MTRLLILFAPLLLALSSSAQYEEFEQLLMPVIAYDVPGAHGSLWNSHLWVQNASGQTVSFGQSGELQEDILFVNIDCELDCPQPPPLGVGEGREIRPHHTFASPPLPARLLLVRKGLLDHLNLSLRIQDTSRALMTFGTEVPLVRERDLLSGSAVFMPVPTAQDFRQSIRIYAHMEPWCLDFDVRIFDLATGETIDSIQVTTFDESARSRGGTGCSRPLYSPTYAAVHSLTQATSANLPDLVGIEVRPRLEQAKYWAFVTVTSDITQHVTTILP